MHEKFVENKGVRGWLGFCLCLIDEILEYSLEDGGISPKVRNTMFPCLSHKIFKYMKRKKKETPTKISSITTYLNNSQSNWSQIPKLVIELLPSIPLLSSSHF